MDQELLKAALRVLNAYALKVSPNALDVETMRKEVPESESLQNADALAVQIVERELKVVRRRKGKAVE